MQGSYQAIFQAIGGVGLFLLGMTIMTDGLKALEERLTQKDMNT